MSHAEQTDLRIRRTHHFLQEAMIELITEKGFDAITMGDIAEHARMAGQHDSNIMVMSLHWQDTSFDGNGNG